MPTYANQTGKVIALPNRLRKVRGAMRPKKRKNPNKVQLVKPRRGKTAEPRLHRLNSLIDLGSSMWIGVSRIGHSIVWKFGTDDLI